jgi:hypothetical protein
MKNNSCNRNGQLKLHALRIRSNPAPGDTCSRTSGIDAGIERALVGSLTDSYDLVKDGLVKKTISVTCDGMTYQLVAYYSIADATSRKMSVLSKDLVFMHIHLRPALIYLLKSCNLSEDGHSINRFMYFDNS